MTGTKPAAADRRLDALPQFVPIGGDFSLAATPTTVGQYWAYLVAAGLTDRLRPDLHGFPAHPGRGIVAGGDGTLELEPERADLPVAYVSWRGAQAYCTWLSGRVGEECRLPTETEWRHAAGGPEGWRWALGERFVRQEYVTSAPGPQPVRQGAPNGYGLYDVTGQVFEWTNDVRPGSDELPGHAPSRIVKGGAFILRNPENFENGAVFTVDELSCLDCVGFRVLRAVERGVS